MKFSIEWLKKFITVNGAAQDLSAQITSAALEVESFADGVFVLKVPPNRADCLGMVGLSRDIAAITKQTFREPLVQPVAAKNQDKISLQVKDSKACPRYLGRVIRGIDNARQTPQWIKDCLTTADMSLISPVVDITNYVLLEWGQPLHAFDMRKINGGIIVRKANKGEELQLLDDSTVKLTPDTLVIADETKALAVAGVKGGKESGIELDTKDILIECAYFDPISVRLTSRALGLKTDGAYRFERCIDPTMQEKVMEHVTQMIIDIVGGEAGPVIEFSDPNNLPKTMVLALRLERVKKILGIDLDLQTVTQILERLGFQVENHNSHSELMVTVPPFRQDIALEVDLIEEIARIYGLDQIPAQTTIGALDFMPLHEAKVSEHDVISCLVNRGYHETINYSFIDFEYAKLFSLSIAEDLQITNPISSEMGFMRPSLLPGLVKAVQYNQNRQQDRIRLFEIGLRFTGTLKNVQQTKTIAGVCYGRYLPESCGNEKRLVDLFDVKGDVLALLKLAHNTNRVKFTPATDVAMHPGQALDIYLDDKLLGKLGVIHPQLQQTLGLPNPVVMFELDYNMLVNGKIASFHTFSKFPTVRRDIAILVDKKVAAGNLEHAIHKEVGDLLVDLVLFDVYQGKGIADNQKSMALGLTLQHRERTLTDVEVNDIFANLMQMLQREFKAVLR